MRRLLPILLVFCLILNTTSVYAAPISQGVSNLPVTCEGVDEADLRNELNLIVQNFFADEKTKANVRSIVQREWYALDMDSAIDFEVDKAANTVKKNTGFLSKLASNWSAGKAEELSREVAELAFDSSSSLGKKIEKLSENVGIEIATNLELISAQSSSYAIEFLQKCIKRQYSQAFVTVFTKSLEDSAQNLDSDYLNLPSGIRTVLEPKQKAIGGAAYFIVEKFITKRITEQVVNRIVQQVVERILGRAVAIAIPIVDVVAIALIVPDILNFDGALNEIQKTLKKPEVKQTFQKEISNTVESQLRSESLQLSGAISNALYSEYLGFQERYSQVRSIAKDLPEFNKLLEKYDPSKVSSLLGLLLNEMGRNELKKYIQDGSFERLLSLPESSYSILGNADGLNVFLEWINLAGNQIEKVVKLEVYKYFSPEQLDRQLLKEILSLNDASTISKFSRLDAESIRKLLTIPKQNLISLSSQLSSSDLQKLSDNIASLDQSQVNQVVSLLLDDSSIIKNPHALSDIVQSRDIRSAIQFWKSSASLVSLFKDVPGVFTGSISLRLFSDKYGIPIIPISIVTIAFFLLFIVMWLRRQWLEISLKQKSLEQTNADKPGSPTDT